MTHTSGTVRTHSERPTSSRPGSNPTLGDYAPDQCRTRRRNVKPNVEGEDDGSVGIAGNDLIRQSTIANGGAVCDCSIVNICCDVVDGG